MRKIITILVLLSIVNTQCKKQTIKSMEEEKESVQPVMKSFEGKFISNNTSKDTITISFVKQLSKDSNEYIIKDIYKAISKQLKPNSIITNKDYIIQSNEISKIAYSNDRLSFSIFPDGRLVLTSNQLNVMNIIFNKQN